MLGFVSYSHRDKKLCDAVRSYLDAVGRTYGIPKLWTDECTTSGRCFRAEYRKAVERSAIHVLIISKNYLVSDEIMERELKLIEQKQYREPGLVFPVVLDNCFYDAVVGSLTASPRDESQALRPLLDWKPLRKGLEATAQQFGEAIERQFHVARQQLARWRSP